MVVKDNKPKPRYGRLEINKNHEDIEKTTQEQNELIFAFSKKVKGNKVKHTKISDIRDIKKIKGVLDSLPQGKKRGIEEIELHQNPKKWIKNLFEGYPSNIKNEDVESLINDFTDNMRTRMREEDRYAIGLLSYEEVILCHSAFGEETITPEWKAIPRMLDPDNVMRYVHFKKENLNSIQVKYYERYSTDSFVDWLGLSQKDSVSHFGGKYRVCTEIGGIPHIFELSEEKLEKWIEEHPEIKKSQIKLKTPIEILNITQIWVGRRRYENPKDFLQDFYAERYRLNYYQEQFKKIISSIQPYLYKFFDEKSRVVMVEGKDIRTVVEKRNPHFDMLFTSKNIECRESYLDDIFGRFINGEKIKFYHSGMPLSYTPLEIGSMEIWNDIKLNDLIQTVIKYYHDTNLQDRTLMRSLGFAIFTLLDIENRSTHIHYFLEKFSKKFLEDIATAGKITKLEDKILEYKSREYFTGKDEEIAKKLSKDLKEKLEKFSYKIYLVGVEDSGIINPLLDNRVKSDRVENIKQIIKQKIQVTHLYLLPVKFRENKNILILIAGDKNVSGI